MFWDGLNPGERKREHSREKVAHPAERKRKSGQEPGWSPDKQSPRLREELNAWHLPQGLRPSKVGLGLVGFCLVQWEEWTVPYSLNQVIILIVGLQEKDKVQGNRGAPEWMFRHGNEKPNHQETSRSRVEGLVWSHLSWRCTDSHIHGVQCQRVPEAAGGRCVGLLVTMHGFWDTRGQTIW